MDNLGLEVGQKMRSAVKAKLMELGCYVDDELPDYIMVMVANKRTKLQMKEDLQLFLSTKTEAFVDWLQIVLIKLKEITHTNTDTYKRAVKRKSEEPAKVEVKPKKEKKDKLKLIKKPKKKEIKPTIKDLPQLKSLTDDLPVEASRLSEMRKIVIMQENQTNANMEYVNENNFDIPPLSEVGSENELVEIENKIKSVKSRLGLQVPSESEDEDFLNIKAEPDDLFPNEQTINECKEKRNEDKNFRKINLITSSLSTDNLLDISTKEKPVGTQVKAISPKQKTEHPRIIFSNENVNKKLSALERLGKKASPKVESNVNCRRTKINLAVIRKEEQEILAMSKTDDGNNKNNIPNSAVPRESVLKRLGVMSKVAIPQKDDEETDAIIKDVPSVIKVKPRVLPPSSTQANKNLLLKAVAEAQRSIAQTPIVGTNVKPDALFTKNYRQKIGSGKLPEKEKNKIRNILVQADRKNKREHELSSDDENVEYVSKLIKKPKKIKKDVEHNSTTDDFDNCIDADYSDIDSKSLNNESKSQKFVITLDGFSKQTNVEDKPKSTSQEKKRKSPSPIIFNTTTNTTTSSKSKQVPGNLPVVIPQPTIKTKERCKYWPNCRQGEKCEFIHPSMNCKSFPQCKFGEKCLYIHPMCKFVTSCTRKECPYDHKSRVFNNVSALQQMCKFYPNCNNIQCMYYHPRPCKYGKYCKNQNDCNFSHNFHLKSNFSWRSTLKL